MYHQRDYLRLRRHENPPLRWDPDYFIRKKQIDQQNLFKKEASISDESEYWVAVYGFDSENINSAIDVFRKYGRISNFFVADDQLSIHIRFESKVDAERALKQDGLILNDFKIWVFSHSAIEDIEISVDAIDPLFARGEIPTRTPRRHSCASEYYSTPDDAAQFSYLDMLLKWKISVPVVPFILCLLFILVVSIYLQLFF